MYLNKKNEVTDILHEWFILANERTVFKLFTGENWLMRTFGRWRCRSF